MDNISQTITKPSNTVRLELKLRSKAIKKAEECPECSGRSTINNTISFHYGSNETVTYESKCTNYKCGCEFSTILNILGGDDSNETMAPAATTNTTE